VTQLKTNRLHMAPWTAERAEAALNSKQTLSTLLGGVAVPEDFPNQPVRDHVLPNKLLELRAEPDRGVWSGIIVHEADNIVIGSMGFKTPPSSDGLVEIGYDIIPDYQGNGYATEMAQALIAWAFEQSSVRMVIAECLPDNWASIRVLQKVGMRQVKSSKDTLLRWELLKAQNNL